MSKNHRLTFVNNPVPGVEHIPVTKVTPILEIEHPYNGSEFKIYGQEYAAPVRADGQCSAEFILEERTRDQKYILEGYETQEQAVTVLTARKGTHVKLVIFGDEAVRIGRGINPDWIERA